MNLTENFVSLNDNDIRIFRSFCDRAVSTRDLLASISAQDVLSDQGLDGISSGEFSLSVNSLMEHEYLHRAGKAQYIITSNGFEMYAKSYIENYEAREDAVREAVSAIDQTDTDAIATGTGEPWYLVNHVLRLLQRRRDISAFVSASNRVHVTMVTGGFKREQAARHLP